MAAEYITCPHCGKQHPKEAKFCIETGKAIPPEKLIHRCPDCDSLLIDNPERCPNCGHDFGAPEQTTPLPPEQIEPEPAPGRTTPSGSSTTPLPPQDDFGTTPLQPEREVASPPLPPPSPEPQPTPPPYVVVKTQFTPPQPAGVPPTVVVPPQPTGVPPTVAVPPQPASPIPPTPKQTRWILWAVIFGLTVVAGIIFFLFILLLINPPKPPMVEASTRSPKSTEPSVKTVAPTTSNQKPVQTLFPNPTIPPMVVVPSQTLISRPTIPPSKVAPSQTPTQTPPSQLFSWAIEYIDQSPEVGKSSSLAIDNQGSPHIAYYDDNKDKLRYAEYVDNSWKPHVLGYDEKEKDGFYPSLALDSSGTPHIAFYVFNQNKIRFVKFIDNKWSELTPLTNLAPISNKKFDVSDLSLTLDRNNTPHLIFSDKRYGNIIYASLINNQWIPKFVDELKSEDFEVDRFPLVLDKSDQPLTCFFNKITGLNYAYLSDKGWIPKHDVDPNLGAGTFPSLTLDSKDYPHIAYYDQINLALKHAYWNGVIWINETLDSDINVGKYPSIAIDQFGFIHISYYDQYNSALKYAFWNGSRWKIDTIDNDGDVGKFTSLALNKNGEPRISYYDATNGWLKFANASRK